VIFEMMLTYANHLGLYAAQIGASGEALGDFPQAFTRLALISAAVNLDRARTANEPAGLATAPRAMEKLEHVLMEGVTRWL
jgi:hypothetical protein